MLCTLLPGNGPSGCADHFRVADPAFNLESPDLSPDGRLLAVVQAASATQGAIALYDAATGALARRLTAGPADGAPGGRVTVSRGTTVAFRLVRKGRVVGRSKVAAAPGGILRFRVPLGASGRRQLARSGRLRVALRIAVTAPGGTPERARRSVTLRG